ncbi:Gfo/Idh/MocA family protein [Cryobacterium sp. Hz9]|uniref:Gfo/Idh/MocA family protein n=1 Tax=Cryobacterium sp. Hz9 TaxID=1259167 RepID=UPI00106DA63B|nr:Gfo/Idh/MocA family oxidoreductase [Cryobacterium sp. Hz9]TFB67513.1 gfo/Idh/MocA family oxidoreductase [Cryobacterium sp. Hz9]
MIPRQIPNAPAIFAIVGGGFRAVAFLRVARELPEYFRVCGVVARRAATVRAIEADWNVPTFGTVEELLGNCSPDFVVVAVMPSDAPELITELARRKIPVLTETPPAPDIPSLLPLLDLVQDGALIQVAEQYHLEPLLTSQIAVARSGILGTVGEASVSVCHDYHGMSVLRRILGIGFENATITAHERVAPLVAGPTRAGDPHAEHLLNETHTSARLDFGDRLGCYDFSSDQYRSWLRSHSMLVRGDRGELRDEQVRTLDRNGAPLHRGITRVSAGGAGNHEGLFLRGLTLGDEWTYVNEFAPARLADDELSIAALLVGMSDHVMGGPAVYSLAEAAQDHYLQLAIKRAVVSGETVRTETQPWATSALGRSPRQSRHTIRSERP